MNALARERVQVRRKGGNEGFTFTCFHLGDTSLMKDDSADNLYRKVLHAQHAPARLAARRERLGQKIVERFAVGKTLLKESGLVFELALAHFGVLVLKRKHLVADRLHALNLALAVVAEHRF